MSWPTITAKTHIEMCERQQLAKSGTVYEDARLGPIARVTNGDALSLLEYWRLSARAAGETWDAWSRLAIIAVGEDTRDVRRQVDGWYPGDELADLWRQCELLAVLIDGSHPLTRVRRFSPSGSAVARWWRVVQALNEDARKGGHRPPVVLPPRPRLPSGKNVLAVAVVAWLLLRKG